MLARGSIYENELKTMLKSRGYFVTRSAGSFATDLIAIKKSVRPMGIEVKSCKSSTFYLNQKARDQLEELKRLEREYDLRGCFAVRFKQKGRNKDKSWVFLKAESVTGSVRSDAKSDFDF